VKAFLSFDRKRHGQKLNVLIGINSPAFNKYYIMTVWFLSACWLMKACLSKSAIRGSLGER